MGLWRDLRRRLRRSLASKWQVDRNLVENHERLLWFRVAKRKLTTGVRVDLPILIEGPACRKDSDHTGDKTSDDEGEPNPDGHAITTAETIL